MRKDTRAFLILLSFYGYSVLFVELNGVIGKLRCAKSLVAHILFAVYVSYAVYCKGLGKLAHDHLICAAHIPHRLFYVDVEHIADDFTDSKRNYTVLCFNISAKHTAKAVVEEELFRACPFKKLEGVGRSWKVFF